jgi:hypothetical protein
MDAEFPKMARDVAVAAGLIDRCAVCEQTYDRGEVDPDDEEELAEAVAAIRRKGLAEADAFTDDDDLGEALAWAIGEAAAEKRCPH